VGASRFWAPSGVTPPGPANPWGRQPARSPSTEPPGFERGKLEVPGASRARGGWGGGTSEIRRPAGAGARTERGSETQRPAVPRAQRSRKLARKSTREPPRRGPTGGCSSGGGGRGGAAGVFSGVGFSPSRSWTFLFLSRAPRQKRFLSGPSLSQCQALFLPDAKKKRLGPKGAREALA